MCGHSLDDLVRSSEYLSYRENLFEQIFCSELLPPMGRDAGRQFAVLDGGERASIEAVIEAEVSPAGSTDWDNVKQVHLRALAEAPTLLGPRSPTRFTSLIRSGSVGLRGATGFLAWSQGRSVGVVAARHRTLQEVS